MLNQRQSYILLEINQRERLTAAEIISLVEKKFERTSKPTVLRDLGLLQTSGYIIKKGGGRAVHYEPKMTNPLLRHIEVEPYFVVPSDKREIITNFNWKIFEYVGEIFTPSELKSLEDLNKKYLNKKKRLHPAALKKEIERLTIELSWKSSELEGNSYSLIDTEILIKEAREARGHSKEEATMILNHKKALDYIFTKPQIFKTISASQIRAIHSILVKGLGVPDGFRKTLVRIIGTNYQPLDNQFQIKDAVDRTVDIINQTKEVPTKAFLATILLSYTQAFVDGNKRTSRLIANALLAAHGWCPLSLRSMDSVEYKKALILFYEQNSLAYFKELFIKQFEFAVKNYFG